MDLPLPKAFERRPKITKNMYNEKDHKVGDMVWEIDQFKVEHASTITKIYDTCPCCPGHNTPGIYYDLDQVKGWGCKDYCFSSAEEALLAIYAWEDYRKARKEWEESFSHQEQEEIDVWNSLRRESLNERIKKRRKKNESV